MTPRIVEVRRNSSKKNDRLAADLRRRFASAGTFVVSLMSSPGAGKTALLERTLASLTWTRRVAALVGDLATDHDAERLRRSGAPVAQITTGTVCHLDAAMIEAALATWTLETIDWLFIENVGNLVCPSSYDLGEHARAVMLSVTEGEDKPLKYPTAFDTADVVVVTKIDLAGAVGFDRNALLGNILARRPGIEIIELSARTGEGFDRWLTWLERRAKDASPHRLPDDAPGGWTANANEAPLGRPISRLM